MADTCQLERLTASDLFLLLWDDFKRARSSRALFGDAAFHRERIAAQLLDDGAGSVR